MGLPRRGPLNRGGPGRAVPESALVLVRSFGRGRLKAASPRLQVKPFEADRDRRAAALARARAKAAGRVVGGGPGADALSGALAGSLAERLVVDVSQRAGARGPPLLTRRTLSFPRESPTLTLSKVVLTPPAALLADAPGLACGLAPREPAHAGSRRGLPPGQPRGVATRQSRRVAQSEPGWVPPRQPRRKPWKQPPRHAGAGQ